MARRLCFFVAGFLMLTGCTKQSDNTLFRRVPPGESGVSFNNTIYENDSINILKLEYVYNGGGVAVGDFNNDGLTDIFFTGNQVPNRLYLNKGNLKFEDITEKAGLADTLKWRSGVALADINEDGWLDIYVCATIKKDSSLRANMLFINKGLNGDGIPTFTDEALQYGVADTGHSQNAAFLDYDRDGDLDLYVLTNTSQGRNTAKAFEKITDGSSPTTDRLYRNNGNGTFTNVSWEAGILLEGYGLGLAIADFNNDNWPDIYVGNDYLTNDIMYINNHDGTFTNRIDDYIKHQSRFSMGNDVADINNDGFPDVVTLDMLPEGNLRRKTVILGGNYTDYINNDKYGYSYQYVRNMLQLNNGNGTFSEIGQLSGIYQTEWSWSPLMADFDNDGNRDLMITNGFPKDVTDHDFGVYRSSQAGSVSTVDMLLDSIPVVKVSNYAYKSEGNLGFKNVTKEWGLFIPSFSNGAAFADLDNDGDLDYVVNNINDPAFLFENTLYKKGDKNKSGVNFLRVKLKGSKGNPEGLGAKIRLSYDNGKIQYHDHSLYRGYLSSVEPVIHFGVGKSNVIDMVEVTWPDGSVQQLTQVKANQVLTLDQADARQVKDSEKQNVGNQRLFVEASDAYNIHYKHVEDDKIDFNLQRTIPHKYTQYGPGLAVADVNGDGLEDFYVGGSAGKASTFFIQKVDGTFQSKQHLAGEAKPWEDLGILFFDADGDGDADLYTVSGSIEWERGSENYRDKFYINDGKGNFKDDTDALPDSAVSGSCVRAADYDMDGDLDLFVGGRTVPGSYPLPGRSFILNNENGRFKDVTEQIAGGLKNIGMVTDALWSDFDNDGKIDLIVVGELMPVTFFKNTGDRFVNVTNESGVSGYSGWWNSIVAGDFDFDGDMDYVAGNLGLNNYYQVSLKEPVKIFAKDFDGNGSIDPVIGCYLPMQDGTRRLCPVHFWDELISLSPKFRKQFSSYKQYGNTTIDELLSPKDLEGALTLEADYASSSYIENKDAGKFTITELPVEAQFTSVNGLVTGDFNGDQNLDVLLVGNDFGNEVFSGRMDAFIGLVLLGDGKGSFIPARFSESGFVVSGDAKALVKLYDKKGDELILASQNRDSVRVFREPGEKTLLEPAAQDAWAEVTYKDGRKEKVEFNYGSGFLSQSTRKVALKNNVSTITLYDSRGGSRKITPEPAGGI